MSVNVTVTSANITASSTNANITVSETNTLITVSNVATLANANVVRSQLNAVDAGGDGSFTYTEGTGTFTYTGPNQAEANARITAAPTQVRAHIGNTAPILYDATTGVISANTDAIFSNTLANNWFTSQTTDNLTEGSSNLYFTSARVRSNISVTDAGGDGSLAYNSTSGVITYTGPSAGDVRAHISVASPEAPSGNGALSYNSGTGVFTFTPALVNTLSNTKVQTFIQANGLDATANITTSGNVNANGITVWNDGNGPGSGSSEYGNIIAGNVTIFGASAADSFNLDVAQGIRAGNIEAVGDDVRSGNIVASGSVVGAFIHGNGSNLTNLSGLISNAQVKTFIEANGLAASANLTTTANTSAAHGTFTGATSLTATGNVSVGGNLNVTGNINSETVVDLFVEDRNITLQYGSTGTPSANSQIFVDRGSSANTYILWDEGTDKFKFSNDGSTDYPIPTSTSDLAEGTNLYFTAARARGNISVTDAGGIGSLAYNSGTGVITYTGIADTNELSEGSSNRYFTDGRARGAVSASNNTTPASNTDQGFFQYDSGSGDFSLRRAALVPNANFVKLHDDLQNTYSNVNLVLTEGAGSSGDVNDYELLDTSSQLLKFSPGNGRLMLTGNLEASAATVGGHTYGGNITADGNISGTNVLGNGSALTGITSTQVSEGTNLYFTAARARGNISVTDSGGLGSLAYDSGTGVITYTGPSELAAGKINLGSTSGTTIPVTPQNNFVTTANAFNLSNALTSLNSLTSENDQDIKLTSKGASSCLGGTAFTELNKEIDSVNTIGLQADPMGFAIKSTSPWQGLTVSNDTASQNNVTGMVITGTATFTAGSNVVALTGLFMESEFNGGAGLSRDLTNTYGNGMVLVNSGSSGGTSGNLNRPLTYPLTENARTISLANSGTNVANVIMNENSPIDFTWTGNFNWDKTISHSITDTETGKSMYLTSALTATSTTVSTAVPVSRNDYFINDSGTNTLNEFDSSSVTNFSGANISATGFNTTAFVGGVSTARKYKKTRLRSTSGSTSFSNVVLIGRDAQYDDSGFGYNTWPTFGITTLWNGTDLPGNDTGGAQTPPITPGLKFIQFTDQTIQGSGSSNAEEKSTGGPRILLNSSNGNVSLNVAEYYPRQNQGLGVFGVYGSTQTNPFPRTRSSLPGGMYFVASEDWTANSGTDAYFVSTPKLTVGTDTDANAAKMFMASNNGETSLMGTSKVSFFTSGNAFSSGNIVGGYNAIKASTEWANISSTGIQTAGSIAGATTILKKFNETVVALGNQSGDISASLNATNGSIYSVTATGDITINTIANVVAGTSMRIIITQDGTGSRLLTSSMKFEGGSKTLTTAGGSIDIIDVFYDGTNYFAVLSKAYA